MLPMKDGIEMLLRHGPMTACCSMRYTHNLDIILVDISVLTLL